MRGSRLAALVVLVAAGGALAAFLWGASDATRPDRDGVLNVRMERYKFEPDVWHVVAGEPVTFRFENRDEVTHHVSMGRGIVEAENRAVAFEDDLLEGLEVQVRPATAKVDLGPPYDSRVVEVRGGTTVEVSTRFTDEQVGEWHVGCFTGRGCHFRAGLDAVLTIEPPG